MALAEDSVPVFPFHSDVQACEILQQRCMNARADIVYGQNLERQQVFLQNMAFMRGYRNEIETFMPNGVVFQPPFAYGAQTVRREVKGFEQSRPRLRSGKLFDPHNALPFENGNERDLAKNGNGRGSVKTDGNGKRYANGRRSDGNGNGNGRSDGNGKGNGRRSDGNGNGNGSGSGRRSDGNGSVPFRCEMNELEDLLSKLNPMAEEFVPPSLARESPLSVSLAFESFVSNGLCYDSVSESEDYSTNGRQKKNGGQGKKKANRTSLAQQEDSIRRTVYVSDIDHQVTEEQLAALFITCGQVVDCRICGDPNSVLRFAFVEFTDEDGARAALSLAGTMLGYYPVRVLPSKTAIAPVNPTFLPRSAIEREMCARTVYCTNIDKKVCQTDVKIFFETICGEVSRLRLLGDYQHSTRIAFVEFVRADSAIAALDCSGAILGSLAIRVSPSKTPVRARPPRSLIHENGRAH